MGTDNKYLGDRTVCIAHARKTLQEYMAAVPAAARRALADKASIAYASYMDPDTSAMHVTGFFASAEDTVKDDIEYCRRHWIRGGSDGPDIDIRFERLLETEDGHCLTKFNVSESGAMLELDKLPVGIGPGADEDKSGFAFDIPDAFVRTLNASEFMSDGNVIFMEKCAEVIAELSRLSNHERSGSVGVLTRQVASLLIRLRAVMAMYGITVQAVQACVDAEIKHRSGLGRDSD